MAQYKCVNPDCDFFNKESDDLPVWNKYREGKVIDMNLECAACSQPREIITPNKDKGVCTAMRGSQNLCNK